MIKREFIRFVCVGAINTAFSYALYLLLDLVVPYKIAYSLSYVAGIGLSYWLTSRWVFNVEMSLKRFVQFPTVYVVQYVINIICLHVLVENYGWSEKLAPFFVVIISVPVTFLLGRFIMKRPHS